MLLKVLLNKINPFFAADSTSNEQPPLTPQLGHQKAGATAEENQMEINCNGHSSSPDNKDSSEKQGTKESAEEQEEDQQNANQPETNAETPDSICNEEEQETCDASPAVADPTSEPLPASLSSDVAVEPNDRERQEKKMEDMETQGENKKESEEEDNQSGELQNRYWFSLLLHF